MDTWTQLDSAPKAKYTDRHPSFSLTIVHGRPTSVNSHPGRSATRSSNPVGRWPATPWGRNLQQLAQYRAPSVDGVGRFGGFRALSCSWL